MVQSSYLSTSNGCIDSKKIPYNIWESSSVMHDENIKEFIGNDIINNCTNATESFHFIVYDSFYSTYLDLFTNFHTQKVSMDLPIEMPMESDFHEMKSVDIYQSRVLTMD